MVLVLKNTRFALFLVVISGFFFLYNQVYNVMPLYVKRVVETSPAMDLYTAANPFVIVVFQLLVTSFFGKMKPVKSMIVGCVIIGVSMGINLCPLYSDGGLRAPVADLLPIASIFIILTVGLIAFGELYTSPRMYEYIGALAPKGQEGLFLGYANLPLAIGSLTGGPVGAWIFNDVMAKGATTRPDGLLELNRAAATRGWLLLMAIGFLSAVSMWAFNRWVEKQEAKETPDPGVGLPRRGPTGSSLGPCLAKPPPSSRFRGETAPGPAGLPAEAVGPAAEVEAREWDWDDLYAPASAAVSSLSDSGATASPARTPRRRYSGRPPPSSSQRPP